MLLHRLRGEVTNVDFCCSTPKVEIGCEIQLSRRLVSSPSEVRYDV